MTEKSSKGGTFPENRHNPVFEKKGHFYQNPFTEKKTQKNDIFAHSLQAPKTLFL